MTQTLLKDNYFDITFNNKEKLDYDLLSFKFVNFKKWLTKQGSNNYTTYIVNQDEVNCIDLISYKIYGNSAYWWIIAIANNMLDPVNDVTYQKELIIPSINSINKFIAELTKTEQQVIVL